jgi:hypothetical protein
MATRNRLTANTVAEALLRSKSLEGQSRSAIRRRDRRGEADQGLLEGEERGLHARGFLSADGACEEGFEGGRVSWDSKPAALSGMSFEALAFARAPQNEVSGVAPAPRSAKRFVLGRGRRLLALTIQGSPAPHRPIGTSLGTTHGP